MKRLLVLLCLAGLLLTACSTGKATGMQVNDPGFTVFSYSGGCSTSCCFGCKQRCGGYYVCWDDPCTCRCQDELGQSADVNLEAQTT